MKKNHNKTIKDKKQRLETSLANILISNYCRYSLYDELNKFVLLYEVSLKEPEKKFQEFFWIFEYNDQWSQKG